MPLTDDPQKGIAGRGGWEQWGEEGGSQRVGLYTGGEGIEKGLRRGGQGVDK